MKSERRILVVDDNPQYRTAVVRNLSMAGYRVIDAEDSTQGMEKIQTDDPQVVITDLDMRTHDEGLQFIRDVKKLYPKMPIIMISAVGTFDEGALARQYGATFVLSKSRIDSEIETLYRRLDQVYEHFQRIRLLHDQIDRILSGQDNSIQMVQQELQHLMMDQDLDTGLKSEVYELLERLDQHQAKQQSVESRFDTKDALEKLAQEIAEVRSLDQETQTMLALADSMRQSTTSPLSLERNVGFSYSFAVENEVKIRLGKKITKLISSELSVKLAKDLYDESINNLDIFFSQYLIRTTQMLKLELNADITRQVMERIIQHGSKYKPDGLKALGVILFCWGRAHSFSNRKKKIEINNPLGIKGMDDDVITQLADQLILLQHLRNPYIHPEFSEREKTESVRQTALKCLSLISRIV